MTLQKQWKTRHRMSPQLDCEGERRQERSAPSDHRASLAGGHQPHIVKRPETDGLLFSSNSNIHCRLQVWCSQVCYCVGQAGAEESQVWDCQAGVLKMVVPYSGVHRIVILPLRFLKVPRLVQRLSSRNNVTETVTIGPRAP